MALYAIWSILGVCLFLMQPRGGRRAAAPVVALALMSLLALDLADRAVTAAYGRPFNPFVDIHLAEAGARLLAGILSLPLFLVVGLAGIVAPVCAFLLLWAGLSLAARYSRPTRGLRAGAALTGLAAMIALIVMPGGAAAIGSRVAELSAFRAQMLAFDGAARDDARPLEAASLDGLERRDVILVFVESYGRTSVDNPRFAAAHDAVRAAAQAAGEKADIATVSGWLTAPISGGQSWLAHATLAFGLPVGDQWRYERLLAGGRRSLFQIAATAGYHTAAYMPAITGPWPESRRIGFERLFASGDLGYRGQPFNWVTMPDQFTLEAFERLSQGLPEPRFSQIVLISSHAPFTPIAPILPREQIGDGRIFDRWAGSGDPPDVVWRDRERVRDQYRDALGYSLSVAFEFAIRNAADGRLVIVAGDHAPAGFISQIDSLDVPIHVFGPDRLLARIGSWRWAPGLTPDPAAAAWPMEAFRDRFIGAFGVGMGPS
ncbi:hypothetical protein NDN16_11820 [Aureimonas altamirensis]|uniref:sulfatase-like hydrolase/transferase n=1 Tax=Aureimonas altamirensis TaxID=370622 RepID=UPI0020372B0B|nr:sulfatase-like hydrolase/transferase [Aureimonas altamirensis]MCM2504359.1 hypothetical protein [Aureimonas altamirensis]